MLTLNLTYLIISPLPTHSSFSWFHGQTPWHFAFTSNISRIGILSYFLTRDSALERIIQLSLSTTLLLVWLPSLFGEGILLKPNRFLPPTSSSLCPTSAIDTLKSHLQLLSISSRRESKKFPSASSLSHLYLWYSLETFHFWLHLVWSRKSKACKGSLTTERKNSASIYAWINCSFWKRNSTFH